MSVSSISPAPLHMPTRAVRAEVGTATDRHHGGEPGSPAGQVLRMDRAQPETARVDAPISAAFEHFLDSLSDAELEALEELDTAELLALVDAIERPETRPMVRLAPRMLHRVA